jgi:hypothetical protein
MHNKLWIIGACLFFTCATGVSASWAQEESFELELEEIDLEEVEDVPVDAVTTLTDEQLSTAVEQRAPEGKLFSIPRHTLLTWLGIVTFVFLLLTIMTRFIRPTGQARRMLNLHKTCAWLTLILAACHASFALFW